MRGVHWFLPPSQTGAGAPMRHAGLKELRATILELERLSTILALLGKQDSLLD
jgi:hypothetical protein